MEYYGDSNDYIYISKINKNNVREIKNNIENNLMIFWNQEKNSKIIINEVTYILKPQQIVLLTEFHNVEISEVNEINYIKFNRNFYCIHNFNEKIGCRGVLFNWASQVPIISLTEDNKKKFEILWENFIIEFKNKDELQGEMLQILLKRFLILATRIYKEFHQMKDFESTKVDILRDYFLLVETHFKTIHSVNTFAEMLNTTPKNLSNLFAKNYYKNPLKIIQERIIIEAKRLLTHSNKSIKEIAYFLGFEDLPSFSRFFKNKQGVSPKEFRNSTQ